MQTRLNQVPSSRHAAHFGSVHYTAVLLQRGAASRTSLHPRGLRNDRDMPSQAHAVHQAGPRQMLELDSYILPTWANALSDNVCS